MASTSFFGKTKKAKKKTQDEFSFTLTNVDIAKIDKDFNMEKIKEFGCDITSKIIFDEGTSLERLGISSLRKEPITTIISKDKRKIQSYISLVDIVSNKKLPVETSIPCHGCRRKFTSQPIGIPLDYHPSVYVSKNDPTKIRHLTQKDRTVMEADEDNTVIIMDYFDTEGIVCSFNCILLCIEDSPSPMYTKTPLLIYKLYKMIFGVYPSQPILKAPSWKMREEYGGSISDFEYEKILQTIKFTDTHQVQKVQRLMEPQGRIFNVQNIDLDPVYKK